MRCLMLATAALAVGMISCGGGQPRTYKVAINQTALAALPTSCYRTNNAPQNTTAVTSGFVDSEWTIWDGPADKQYLDIGTNTWVLGDANAVVTGTASNVNPNNPTLPSLIEGSQKTFTEQRVFTRNTVSPAEVDTRSVTVTFDDVPGDTAKGHIDVSSHYTCSNCGLPSCDASLPFVGRKINAQPSVIYSGQ